MMVCLLITNFTGGSINTMLLGGLALVFSRLIDNGVIVLENIFRHMENGAARPWLPPKQGGSGSLRWRYWQPPFTTAIVFFPVDVSFRCEQVHLYAAGDWAWRFRSLRPTSSP